MNRIAISSLFMGSLIFFALNTPNDALAAAKKVATPSPSPTPTPAPPATATPTPDPAATPKQKGSRAPLDSNNVVRINYANSTWNKSPTAIDSASILMREGTTGRTVQIHIEEDAPNSAIFTGLFSINWHNIDKLQVEFYTPPQELFETADGMKQIRTLIDKNQLKRRPFLLRRGDTHLQSVEIFDSVEQAQAALKTYRNEIQIESSQGLKNKVYPTNAEIDISKFSEKNILRATAASLAAERIRMYQEQVHRLQDLTAKFLALKVPEREVRRKQAAALMNEAAVFTSQTEFEKALDKYNQAIELDPQNRTAIYQYGLTLYRLLDYNRSIVFLQLAEGEGVNEPERQYYLALNYFALKDYDNANAAFEKVNASKSENLAPSAQFYIGVVKYEAKEWEASQKAFQNVLDTSSDSNLDKQAETYIELILRARQFDAERAKKWTLSGTIGELADSNVLLSSGSSLDLGTASDSFGYRTLLMGSARYRPVYDEQNEFSVEADILDMYTVDKTLAATQALRNSDPTVVTLMAPWSLKTTAFDRGYRLDLVPGYETIFMSIENNTTKAIVTSYLLNIDNLFYMTPKWFANWNIETRKDTSGLDSSTGDNDANAIKVKFANVNTIVLNAARDKFATAEISYTMNQAVGREVTYNRIDLAVGYLQPFYWDTAANAKLNYYLINYQNGAAGRVDNDFAMSFGATKKLNEILSTGLAYVYTINNSTIDLDAYKKWTLMATLSASIGL